MFHETSTRLVAWAADSVGEPVATLASPAGERKGRGVGLYLLDLRPLPRPHGAKVERLQISLRYLITAWADRPEDSHGLLGRMAVAAMTAPDLELEADPPPAAVWAALGAPPQPCLLVRVMAWHEIPRPTPKVVTDTRFVTTVVHSPNRSNHRA